MQTSDSVVIIPTYNEKENIENIIRAVFGLEKCFHILVIEDNSPDGTAGIVRQLQAEFPTHLLHDVLAKRIFVVGRLDDVQNRRGVGIRPAGQSRGSSVVPAGRSSR